MATMRRRRAGTTRDGDTAGPGRGAGVAAGARTGLSLLARVVSLITAIVVGIIVIAIVLVLLKANPTNSIVSQVHDWARSLAGPFDGMFTLSPKRVETAVNWGIAAVVWYMAGHLIARLIGR